jgi:5-methylcytosine-specific restriction endonuclease McrA
MPRKSKYPWYHKFIVSSIRQVLGWSPAKKQALARANGKCEQCGKKSEVLHVDHIIPNVPVTGWDSYDGSILRTLAVSSDGLQVLCPPHHQAKTNAETKERKKNEAKGK